MRFGHTMHRHFVPEWSEHYVDYNLLKCLIKLSNLPEAYQHLDASIFSLDGFLRPRLDRLSNNINSAVLDPKKLGWFQEINARAVWRILAKLARHGQVDTLSYRSLRARWQTLQSAWDTQLASIVDTTSSGPVLAEVATDMTSADAILSADDDGLTALHLAVIGGCVPAASAMISVLYADGGERARNAMGDLLLIALRTQNDPIIYCLLTSCADLYHRSSRGEIALHVAVQVQRIDYAAPILQAMRKQGASLDVPDSSRAWTPLFFACANGCAEMAQLLIEAGSSQEQRDRLGWTAREIASYKGHLVVAGLFAVLDTSLTGDPANTLSHPKADASNRGCSHDQRVIIISLGATHSDRAVAGLDLSSWFCRKYEAASFVLDISAPGASERRRVPLPILDHQMHDVFCFIVSNTTEPCLVFDMIRLPRIPGKEVLVASGTALLTKNAKQLGTYRQSLIREQSVPILEKSTMRMAGVVTFTPLVVHPFPHLQTARPIDLMRTFPTPPLLIGHRGAGQNVKTRKYLQIGENTIGSFLSAAKLGASYVEFDIQITRDRQAVAFHDLSLSESGTDIPIHDVTLDQFLHATNTQSPHGNPLSMLGPAHSREEAGRPRSRSLGRQFEAGATQVRDRIKYTVDFNKKGFKPNTRGSFIQDSFATLQEILITLPQNIGCDIEIKYPRLHETVDAGVAPVAIELNTFVDIVLNHLHNDAGNRQIILSSFTPEICILLAIKQKAYPVFFITNAGKVPMSDMDVRAASLQNAVHFAEHWGLTGVVFACETLTLCPRLVGLVKARGLVCGTYGTQNNHLDMVELQTKAGVDLIVSDQVGLVAKSLAGQRGRLE